MPHLLAVGYGYSAQRVGATLVRDGWTVTGSRRSPDSSSDLRASGVGPVVFDGRTPSEALKRALESVTHLLVSAPPGDEGDPLLVRHGSDVRSSPALRWIGYLSTTGVYGDHGGRVVTEDTPVRPRTERARRRVEAEQAWTTVAADLAVTLQVFRLSGIYGPGRSVLDRLRDGSARAIVSPELVFNRIHVDDIAGAVLAGIARPERAGVFNVSDDLPAPPSDVVEHGARLLGVEPPARVPLEEASLSEGARSFYTENKRVDNARLRSVLGYGLLYPTYREGLEALVAAGG